MARRGQRAVTKPQEELREPAYYLDELKRLTGESTAALTELEMMLGHLQPSEAADDPLRLVREAKKGDEETRALIASLEAQFGAFKAEGAPVQVAVEAPRVEAVAALSTPAPARGSKIGKAAPGRASKIPQDVLEILSVVRVEGCNVFLPETKLERKLYEGVNAVLAELGGKWMRKVKAHVFADDPTERLNDVINAGEIVTAASLGFFATPVAIVKRLIEVAAIKPGECVLEPSAGDGAIVRELLAVGAKVTCCEYDKGRSEKLRALPVWVCCGDFLAVSMAVQPDAVVMNPPFARQQDIDHVRKAFSYLKLGGRLVSVMGAGVLFRQDAKARAFREWVAAQGGQFETLPEGSFAESGTGVRTVIVQLTRREHVEQSVLTC